MPLRRLLLVFGDQLNADASVFDGADRDRDVVWMAEASSEATVVWSHRQRAVPCGGGAWRVASRLQHRLCAWVHAHVPSLRFDPGAFASDGK